MAHMVETVAYSGQVPWYGFGHEVPKDVSVKEMLNAAGLNWGVVKKPLYFPWEADEDGVITMKRAHGECGLIRTSDMKMLSRVGDDWQENQNEDVFEFFRSYVEAGSMNLEVAGSLRGGRFVWGLAALGQDFELVTGDKVSGYLLLCSPHAYGFRFTIQFTPIRVVCNNTLTWSLREGPQAGTQAFRMTHRRKFDDAAKKEAEETLGLAMRQMDWFKGISEKLAECRVNYEERIEYFKRVANIDQTMELEDEGEPEELPRIIKRFETALEDAPGAELPSAKDTAWGLVNAVSYTVDHVLGRERDTALYNAWLGQNAAMKRRAVDFAIELAEAA